MPDQGCRQILGLMLERKQALQILNPHFPKAKASPGSLVASAKSCPSIERSPIWRRSLETNPSMEPEPY